MVDTMNVLDMDAGRLVQGVAPAADKFLDYALYFLAGVAVIALIAFMLHIKSYKHRVVIKRIVGGAKRVQFDKFRIYTDRDKINWYQLLKRKIKLEEAPPDAIETDIKGNLVVHLYDLGNDVLIYAKDISKPIPDEILKMTDKKAKEAKVKEWMKEVGQEHAIVSSRPLTTTQKVILANQYMQAQDKKGKTLMEVILPISFGLFFVVTIALLLIFGGDFVKAFSDASKENTQLKLERDKVQYETLQLLNEIKQNIQRIPAQTLAPVENVTAVPN